MQDSYIAELEKQNEELREKLEGVEEELDKMKEDTPYRDDLNELYKKFFDKKKEEKNPYDPSSAPAPTPHNPYTSPPVWPGTWPGNGTVWCNSSESIKVDKAYEKIVENYINPSDGFECDDG
jgi:hypothetical protein